MKFFFMLFALMMLLAGCSLDNPAGREADNPTRVMPSDNTSCIMRPRPLALIAKYQEQVEVIKPPNPAEGDFTVIVEINATGFCTHLGPSKMYTYEYIDISTYPTKIVRSEGAYISSIATGDKLTGWMTGYGYPEEDGSGTRFEGTFYITGGTGELQGAQGEAEFWGETEKNPDGPNTGWVKFKGYYILDSPAS